MNAPVPSINDIFPSTRRRRRWLNALAFSSLGMKITPRAAQLSQRLYHILVNDYLDPELNGEYWLVSRLHNPRVLVDAGFHRGYWTLAAATSHPDAEIHVFDPWPPARSLFLELDLDARVYFYEKALSDRPGRLPFYDYGNGRNSLARSLDSTMVLCDSYEVNITTLDAWALETGIEHIDFLKIDVEGYDLAVLEGAKSLLSSQAIDAFCFEYAANWIEPRRFLGDACSYIKSSGYSLYKLFPSFLVPYDYSVLQEDFYGAMYVALSEASQVSSVFPIRPVRELAPGR